MNFPRTLTRYVLTETLVYTGLGVLALGAILIGQNLLRQLLDLVPLGVTAGDAAAVTVDLALMMAGYVLPVGLLFGTLAGLGRLASDREILAMRALGVGRSMLLIPLLPAALLVAAGTAVLLDEAQPLGRRHIRAVVAGLASSGGFIQAAGFTDLDRGGHRTIFADKREGRILEGVLLSDRSDAARPFVVAAERGEFKLDSESGLAALILERGDVHFEGEPGEKGSQRIAFRRLNYEIDLSSMIGGGVERYTAPDFTTSEIRDILHHFDEQGEAPEEMRVRERGPYEREIARRSALPGAAVVLVLLAIPLATRVSSSARSVGLMLCIGLSVLYYASLSAATVLIAQTDTPARVAMWAPNLVFGLAALGLWLRRDVPR